MKHEYRELKIWKNARVLNKELYELTSTFPDVERYGLVSQMRRATVSIASNIAEGSANRSSSMFSKYLDISLGSVNELETQLYLSFDISYLDKDSLNRMLEKTDTIKRMIIGFKKSLF